MRHANGNADGDSNGYANTDSYTNCDSNGYANTDSYANGHSNGYANTDSYTNGHCNSYGDGHSYGHFNTYSNSYAGGQTYADTQAAAAASSAGRAIIGTVKAGTREQKLASSPACGDRLTIAAVPHATPKFGEGGLPPKSPWALLRQ